MTAPGTVSERRWLRRARTVCSFALTLFVVGCASGGGAGAGAPPSASERLAREEIALIGDTSAEQVVRTLRPRWLQARRGVGFGGPSLPEVFVDGLHLGPLSTLRQISSRDIESMELIGAADATTLYGTGYAGGVISVRTIR